MKSRPFNVLDLAGCMVTIDAIGCQTEMDIYQLIRDTGVKSPFLCGEGSLYDLNTSFWSLISIGVQNHGFDTMPAKHSLERLLLGCFRYGKDKD